MKTKLKELVARLVSFNTVSDRSNLAMADFLCNFLQEAGFEVTRYPYWDKQGIEKINVIAKKGGEESFLTFCGHMDTVPFEGRWKAKTDPLVFEEIGERAYGRGIADMKLFIAIALMVGKAFPEKSLRKPFSLCFTADEEIGCVGAKKLLRETNAKIGKFVVLGEPTELVPVRAHKGYLYFTVNFSGKTGHSSDPKNGISIVPALYEVGQKLESIESRLKQRKAAGFDPNYATLNQGVVSTHVKNGNELVISSKNLIAGKGVIEVEVRTLPEQSTGAVFQTIKVYLGESSGQTRIHTKMERSPTPAMETNIDSLLVREIERIANHPSVAVNFNTEGGVFTKAGSECVVWGPGSIKQAHTENEFVELKYLSDSVVEKYTALVAKLCC